MAPFNFNFTLTFALYKLLLRMKQKKNYAKVSCELNILVINNEHYAKAV